MLHRPLAPRGDATGVPLAIRTLPPRITKVIAQGAPRPVAGAPTRTRVADRASAFCAAVAPSFHALAHASFPGIPGVAAVAAAAETAAAAPTAIATRRCRTTPGSLRRGSAQGNGALGRPRAVGKLRAGADH
jgi:hypothetical protein